MARDQTVLPAICPFTGIPAEPGWRLLWRTLSWSPAWPGWAGRILGPLYPLFFLTPEISKSVFALAFLSLFMVAASILGVYGQENSVSFRVAYPINPGFEQSSLGWRILRWIRFLILAVLLADVVLHHQPPNKAALVGISLLLFVPGFPLNRPFSVVSHRDGWFRIKNLHPGFLAALPVEAPPLRPRPDAALLPVIDCFRDGDRLFVKDGVTLPGICSFTGQSAGNDWETSKFSLLWAPAWTYGFLALAPCAFFLPILVPGQAFNLLWVVIAIFIATLVSVRFGKRGSLQGFASPEARHKRSVLNAVTGLIVALYVAFIFSGPRFGALVASIAVLILTILFVRIRLIPRLRPVYYRDGWFLIKGCHPGFLARLPPVER